MEYFVTLPPAQDWSNTVIAEHVRRAHQAVHGERVKEGVGLFYSDASHLQAYGIPAVNYGPAGRTLSGKENWDPDIGEHLCIEDLTATARVYATIAVEVLSRTRAELGLRTAENDPGGWRLPSR